MTPITLPFGTLISLSKRSDITRRFHRTFAFAEIPFEPFQLNLAHSIIIQQLEIFCPVMCRRPLIGLKSFP